MYPTIYLYTHMSVDTVCFPVLANMNNAAMTRQCTKLFEVVMAFPSDTLLLYLFLIF